MSYWIVCIWQFTFNIDCFGSFESYSVLLFAHRLSTFQLDIAIIHFINYSVNWKSRASLQIFPTTVYDNIWSMYTFFFNISILINVWLNIYIIYIFRFFHTSQCVYGWCRLCLYYHYQPMIIHYLLLMWVSWTLLLILSTYL